MAAGPLRTEETWKGMAVDDRERLRQQFLNVEGTKHTERWDDLWQRGVTPWDRKGPSLALRDAVTRHSDILGTAVADDGRNRKGKRALVPGCGRGYDVLNLASLGYDAFGLDASKTAIEEAKKIQADADAHEQEEYSAAKDRSRGQATFLLHDFFHDGFLADTHGGDFDLIFDYTFLCALPPEMRPAWAKRMSELLAPTGHLICLEWPLGKNPREGGPPHGLTSELYRQLFLRPGENVEYDAQGHVKEKSEGKESGSSLVRVAYYMPERTHEAGKGKDFISIWGHTN